MVHLTYNRIERGKSTIECKIELFTRYHSGMPYQIEPKQRSISRNSQAGSVRAYPEKSQPVHSRRISCTVRQAVLCQSVPHCAVIPYSDFSPTEQGRSKRKQPELTCPGLLSARSAVLKSRIAPNMYLWKFIKQRKPRIC